MSIQNDIVSYLNTDTALTAILTGGVLDYPATGREGLNRLLTPLGFSTQTGLVKPLALVLALDEASDDQIVSVPYMSYVSPVVIYILDKGDSNTGYTNIASAYVLIKKDLHGWQPLDAVTGLPSATQMLWKSVVKSKREADILNAAYERCMFNVYGYTTS